MASLRPVTLILVILSTWWHVQANLRVPSNQANLTNHRDLVVYYHTLSSSTLGGPNPDSAIGNPLKGLVESPRYNYPPYKVNIPLSVEFNYVGLDEIMKGNPLIVGEATAFDWRVLDNMLADAASRNNHMVWRIILHFPGQGLKVPKYLIDAGAEMRRYSGGVSPFYGDPKLLEAMEQFIKAAGRRYDGDKRIGWWQAGLLGYWGEWHTAGEDFLPSHVGDKVVSWYASAFTKTEVQARYARSDALAAKFGLHDDSFAYSTLDGPYNGGVTRSWFFWPSVLSANGGNAWKTAANGGETRPELQYQVFKADYQAGTSFKQHFMTCVEVCHMTYSFFHGAFSGDGFSGVELANARHAHARMGYNFHVVSVGVTTSSTAGQVNVDVTVAQIGVAPFYYDLGIGISCSGMSKKVLRGVDSLIDKGASRVFGFTGIPATTSCLNTLKLSLESSYAYAGRPIKFAQGNGVVSFSLPLPPQNPVVTTARMRLTLVDANRDVEIGTFSNGATVNVNVYPSINVRAHPSSTFVARSVVFTYDGNFFRLDNIAPYSFNGNVGSDFLAWTPTLGSHTITATPYSSTDAQGSAGATTSVTFTAVSVGVTDFLLINADSNASIQRLVSGATIRLSALPTRNLNIQAVTNPNPVGSVRFAYNGNPDYRTEISSPYSIGSDLLGDFYPWTLAVGSHTLSAIAFDGSWNELGSRTVIFKVVA